MTLLLLLLLLLLGSPMSASLTTWFVTSTESDD
jgi:hypothetical protein